MKFLMLVSISIWLAGCGQARREYAKLTGNPYPFCYKGIEYIQFPSGSSVAVDREGKPLFCEEKKQ